MSPLTDKTLLITGASAGIGAALAREAAAQGACVVLGARREDRVLALAAELSSQGKAALGVRCDVTVDGDVEKMVNAAVERFGAVDVLIANAGFGIQGRLADLSLDDYRRQFETNVFGVLRSIKAALPELTKSSGAIGVVGSTNGYLSFPGWSAYCMSKHAARSLCASLRHELAPIGVSVTHLALGFVESEFRKVRNDGAVQPDAPELIPGFLIMSSAQAAREILKAVAARREEAVITRHARLAIGFERHTPRLVSAALGASGRLIQALSKQI